MKKYQDTVTGQEWHFDDGVDVSALPNVPKTLSTTIIPRPSGAHEWSNGGWVPNLIKAQSAKLAELSAAYDATIQQPVAYMGTTFQADEASQSMLTKRLAPGSVPVGFFWLDANNAQILMTYAQLQGLAAAMLVQGQAAFTRLQSLKVQVRSATTLDGVAVVTWV